jgi:rod shape determining protein RodA
MARRPTGPGIGGPQLSYAGRLGAVNWPFVALLALAAGVGTALLYSVAGGSIEPWAVVHVERFGFALAALLIAAMIDIRVWMRAAFPLYGLMMAGLVAVAIFGETGGGAQRWLGAGAVQLQPSEFMKVALVLALARHYQGLDARRVSRPASLAVPAALIFLPAILVVRQPDLGTAILLFATGGAIMFAAGVHWLYFAGGLAAVAAAAPFAWQALHGYQQERILAFLDPGRDPLGAGYHIIQAKIALGSGGVLGKGFVRGTQSQLNFVPEKHTDFIFSMLGEEFGLVGALAVLTLFAMLILAGTVMAMRVRNRFGRLAAYGVVAMLFLYVFVNVAMVTGLVPVVGVPLPLVSYGGNAMVSLMVGFGVLMSAHIDRDRAMPRPLVARW